MANLSDKLAREMKPKGRRGRPRVRFAAMFSHYAGFRPERGVRPKCAVRGCARFLRRDQRLACCPDHERIAVEEAMATLAKVRR